MHVCLCEYACMHVYEEIQCVYGDVRNESAEVYESV